MNSVTLSIVICTHNRAELLRATLHSLGAVVIPSRKTVEVIVVNNASTDHTPEVIKAFSETSETASKGLEEPRLGKTYALNTAIKSSAGEVLVFVDDDHLVDEKFIENIYAALERDVEYSLLCGRILPKWDGTEPEWVHDDDRYPIRPFPIPHFDLGNGIIEVEPEKGMFIPGAGNLVVRKSVFDRIGLFSEELGPKGHNLAGGEDIEFVRRALDKGERLLYVPEILQYHQVERSKLELSYLVKKAYLRSMAAYQISESGVNGGVPAYLYGQAMERAAKAVFASSQNARRYYLVRLAAVLGEIKGRRKARTA